jgi:hypothetical protein
VVDIEGPSGVRTVRTKHLVGADGAHSLVRRSMGLKLEGETSDFIWGVVDFVAETDFPDIRRRCAIHSDMGSVMVIPRERIATGEYLTRLYVHVQDDVVKTQAEMRFYNGTELEDAYKVYGVDRKKGAVAVVRPDGYIGVIAELKDTGSIHSYLKGCLREAKGTANGAH